MAFKKRRIFDLNNIHAQQEIHVHSAAKNSLRERKSLKKNARKWHKCCHALKFENIKKWFCESLQNYCQTTSLHGFSYITRQDISRRERIFWTVIVIISIIASIVLVVLSWLWNRETPTVTVIESSHFPTWNIPFPAVTICNFNKISKTKATNLISTMQLPKNTTRQALHQLFYATLHAQGRNYNAVELNTFDQILKMNNMTFNQLSEHLMPDCLEMLSSCIWKGMTTRCDYIFQRILIMEGLCCSFNYYASTTNNFPAKIAYQVPKRPYRVTGCGYPTGLTVLLNPMVDDYYGTLFSSYGFRLLMHDAYNFPDENAETKVVTSTRESFVRINPETTYATNDIRKMDLTLRNCLFGSERRLPTMQRYSFINCMFQCRVHLLYMRCGCVPGYLQTNGSFPICDVMQINCVTAMRRMFSHALPNLNVSLSIVRETNEFPCNCLPDCQSNHYASEITMGQLDIDFALNRITGTKNATANRTDNILLHVFFSDLMVTRYRMEIFQNWLSALASFGGLLGLIMGFSIVAAFEFLYFLTFRPVFKYFNND